MVSHKLCFLLQTGVRNGVIFLFEGVLCSVDSVYSNSENSSFSSPSSSSSSSNNQVIPLGTVVSVPAATNVDSSNLPPPPPLIPISEVLQVRVSA